MPQEGRPGYYWYTDKDGTVRETSDSTIGDYVDDDFEDEEYLDDGSVDSNQGGRSSRDDDSEEGEGSDDELGDDQGSLPQESNDGSGSSKQKTKGDGGNPSPDEGMEDLPGSDPGMGNKSFTGSPTDALNALPTDQMGEAGEKLDDAKEAIDLAAGVGEAIETGGANLANIKEDIRMAKEAKDLSEKYGKEALKRQLMMGVGALIIFLVPVLIVILAFLGYGTESASGLTPGGATAFSCEGKNYVFPYQNKDVPSIPKTHHDYSAVDLMSADGEPLVAVTDGTIRNPHSTDTGDGGISFTIIGNDGYYYYYAHLEYLDSQITKGAQISAGQFVGRSGHTGNASASSPHLHFGISKGEQTKGFYPSMVYSPPQNPAQVSPWKTLEAWKAGQCITPGT